MAFPTALPLTFDKDDTFPLEEELLESVLEGVLSSLGVGLSVSPFLDSVWVVEVFPFGEGGRGFLDPSFPLSGGEEEDFLFEEEEDEDFFLSSFIDDVSFSLG